MIGVRSFGSDPSLVASMAGREVDGYQDANVAVDREALPGPRRHGHRQPHRHRRSSTHTLEQWRQIDLPPFKTDIEHGIDAIMTAHIVVPALDPSG